MAAATWCERRRRPPPRPPADDDDEGGDSGGASPGAGAPVPDRLVRVCECDWTCG
ncbi:MAG TPA: hypothetical protein VKB57_06155 [Acidimicrobiales bacterium]|nr:hypothetical protein [Acidimicrobiales bacterium]